MAELSPTERELATGTLILHPDGQPDERIVIRPETVAHRPELQVEVFLRDVRDKAQPLELRKAWFDRAWQIAEALNRYRWFTLHLALVRHAVLVKDRDRARARANELVTTMLERPDAEIIAAFSRFRDSMHRARYALQVPFLAHAIKLDIADPLHAVIDAALSDRTVDDQSRIDLLPVIMACLAELGADTAPCATAMLEAFNAGAKFLPGWMSDNAVDCYMLAVRLGHTELEKRIVEVAYQAVERYLNPRPGPVETAKAQRALVKGVKHCAGKTYRAQPIYEFDRPPEHLQLERINENFGKSSRPRWWVDRG